MTGRWFHILAFLLGAALSAVTPGCRKPLVEPPPPVYDPTSPEAPDPSETPETPETPDPPEPPDDPPGTPSEITCTLMSYNVGGFKKYYDELGHYSYPEVASVIQSVGAQVIGLNETDWGASRSGGEHQAEQLAGQLGPGWEGRFYNAAYTWYGNSLGWDGTVLETVREYERLVLPKTDGAEVRSMGAVEFKDFTFCVTHLDHVSETDRLNAINGITNWAATYFSTGSKPVFLVGDMNAEPSSATLLKFHENWRQLTGNEFSFSTRNLRKCIDFIFVYKNGFEDKVSVVLDGVVTPTKNATAYTASDHCPYWATLRWTP